MVLQHHEGITHKGDLFTKCLDPCKFQEGLKLLKVRQPQLPPPLKKGKVIDFTLASPPRPITAGNQQRGRSAERGSSGEQRVSRTPSAKRASSCDSTASWEEINLNSICTDMHELPCVRELFNVPSVT